MISKNFLLDLRDKINKIDQKIIKLFSKRKSVAIAIAQEKISKSQPIRDIEREKNLLKKIFHLAKIENLNIDFINKIFKLIIEDSVSIQKKTLNDFFIRTKNIIPTFNFLGPNGSYSYIALQKYAKKYFKKFQTNQCCNFKDIIKKTEEKKYHYAILPIENTSSGAINEVYDLLRNTNLFIIDEIYIPINHCLLTCSDTSLHNIKKIYSHPQPFQQCSQFIHQFPNWKIENTLSSAEAMKKISIMQKNNVAALGSKVGAKIYDLHVILCNIANQQHNFTRFIILSNKLITASEKLPYKTTLLFIIENKPEKLISCLSVLKKNKWIIKKMHYRPSINNSKKTIFYIDILNNSQSLPMKHIFSELYKITEFVKILGVYQTCNFNNLL